MTGAISRWEIGPRWKLRHPHSAYRLIAAIAGGRGKLRRDLGDISLPECEMDRAPGDKKK
jgi:hypothetical protein